MIPIDTATGSQSGSPVHGDNLMSVDRTRVEVMFKQLAANHPLLKEFLMSERELQVKYMTQAHDPVVIHRAQGRLIQIEELLKLLAIPH